MKQDEIKEVPQEDGKNNLFVKKYDIWWPAYKNDKGEVFPNLFAIGDDYKSIHNNLEKMLIALEKSGVKEIDFSHWSFTGVNFNESMLSLMKFADKINFSGADLCYSSFKNGQLKNVDFSETEFDWVSLVNIDAHDCNFNKAIFGETSFTSVDARNCSFYKADFSCNNINGIAANKNEIYKSTFTACKFYNVQLDYVKSTENRFVNCKYKNTDKEKLTSKPSVLGKINNFKDKIASMQNKSQDVKQKQHQHTDVQR